MRKALVVLCAVISVSARLSAELKYTMHMEIKKADMPAAQGNNPMIAMMGEGISKQLLPNGEADIVYIIGDKGTRIEYVQAAMGQPPGTVNLARPDGTIFVLNPKDQTYWKTSVQSAADAMHNSGLAPQGTAKRTGEFDTIAGVRCERVTFDWSMDLPIPEAARASLPPDFPTAIVMAGDNCITTDKYQKYAELAAKGNVTSMMAAMGMDKIAQGGVVLRQNVRFAGIEMRAIVTKIGEEDVPASAFELPAGYKEVPGPGAFGK